MNRRQAAHSGSRWIAKNDRIVRTVIRASGSTSPTGASTHLETTPPRGCQQPTASSEASSLSYEVNSWQPRLDEGKFGGRVDSGVCLLLLIHIRCYLDDTLDIGVQPANQSVRVPYGMWVPPAVPPGPYPLPSGPTHCDPVLLLHPCSSVPQS